MVLFHAKKEVAGAQQPKTQPHDRVVFKKKQETLKQLIAPFLRTTFC
jgi:hypothetical protein